jgi:mannose-1-phosphate guanylyltransferase
MDVYAVIMAGGIGTRLWPLSTLETPKQFLTLIGEESLFQYAVKRLDNFIGMKNIFVVAGETHVPLIREQEPDIPASNIIVEPEGRGTAPCIGLAAAHIAKICKNSVMIILPADHIIREIKYFQKVLKVAIEVAKKGHLVTLGINPTMPATGYGYIESGILLYELDGFRVSNVDAFTEKPDKLTAVELIKKGNYSWNSGMFVWRVDKIMEEFKKQIPTLHEQLKKIGKHVNTPEYSGVLHDCWPKVPKQTIDYGVMENAKDVAVIPVDFTWSDLGTWGSVKEWLDADENNNSVKGNHLGVETRDSLIIGGDRLVATVGISGLIVIDSPDALLICSMDEDQKVREIVKQLERKK